MKIKFIYTLLLSLPLALLGQDTLSGDFTTLKISAGLHLVKEVVTVKGLLTVEPGAKIEFLEKGVIVCEGGVAVNGVGQNIEFYGRAKNEGVGLVIKNIDSSDVNIVGASFKYLQMPLFFDFGWKRNSVNISNNNFIENIGKVSIIQVLNPPFSFVVDQGAIDFTLKNNIFSNNNAAVYFEDLKSDLVKISIVNNTFAGNKVFGFKQKSSQTKYSHEVDLDLTGNMDDILEQMTVTSKALFNMYLNDYPMIQWKEWPAEEIVKPKRKPEDSKLTKEQLVNMTTEEMYNFFRCLEEPYPNGFIEDEKGKLYIKKVSYKKYE